MNTAINIDGVRYDTPRLAGYSLEHSVPAQKRFELPLMFVHGMFSKGDFFKQTMIALGKLGYECYAVTLRGHGDSKRVPDLGKVSVDDYVEDVETVLKALNQKVILIGQSMGEYIASEVAHRDQSKYVAGHIGMTSAPPRWVIMGLQPFVRMIKYLWSMVWGKEVKLSANDSKAMFFNTASPEEAARFISQLCPESGTAAREITLWKYRMKRLACPTLVIAAKFDKITPHQRGIAKMLGADFKEVPTDHMLMLHRDYGTVVNTIHDWLSRRLADSFTVL